MTGLRTADNRRGLTMPRKDHRGPTKLETLWFTGAVMMLLCALFGFGVYLTVQNPIAAGRFVGAVLAVTVGPVLVGRILLGVVDRVL